MWRRPPVHSQSQRTIQAGTAVLPGQDQYVQRQSTSEICHRSRSASSASPSLTFVVLAVGAASFAMLQSLLAPVLLRRCRANSIPARRRLLGADRLAAVGCGGDADPRQGGRHDRQGRRRWCWRWRPSGSAVLIAGAGAQHRAGDRWTDRALQGLGGAIVPLSFGIIRDEFPPARVPSAVGILSASDRGRERGGHHSRRADCRPVRLARAVLECRWRWWR